MAHRVRSVEVPPRPVVGSIVDQIAAGTGAHTTESGQERQSDA